MKLIGMIEDVLSSLFKKPVTESYPKKPVPAPERYRARLDYQAEKCTGCMLCVKDCPVNTIQIVPIDRKTKQFVMTYNIGQCVFCKQCVYNCRFDCLHMTNKMWESASDCRDGFQLYFGKKEHIDTLLENQAKEQAETTESPKE